MSVFNQVNATIPIIVTFWKYLFNPLTFPIFPTNQSSLWLHSAVTCCLHLFSLLCIFSNEFCSVQCPAWLFDQSKSFEIPWLEIREQCFGSHNGPLYVPKYVFIVGTVWEVKIGKIYLKNEPDVWLIFWYYVFQCWLQCFWWTILSIFEKMKIKK